MSHARRLHRGIDQDLVEQIESHGRVKRQPRATGPSKPDPRPVHSYRGWRRNIARVNRWVPIRLAGGGITFKIVWRQPVSATDKFSKGGCPLLSDGTLDHRFHGVVRPNEKKLKAIRW
jgi:hypothetical protein